MQPNALQNLIHDEQVSIQDVSLVLSAHIEEAVADVNLNFSFKELSKAPRDVEALPTDPRQLSSYRTRMGTVLEYAICTALNKILVREYGDDLFLSFVSYHQYPDFKLRNKDRGVVARIEMKAIDAESDEQAARFDVPTHEIIADQDLLLITGWQWKDILNDENQVVGEHPFIFSTLCIPCVDLAEERDYRLKITGGKIVNGEVMVFSKKSNKFVPDPGNYGKFWRIVHRSRIEQENPNPTILKFLNFLEEIGEAAPKNRFATREANSSGSD